MRKGLLLLALAIQLHAGAILDGVFHWNDAGFLTGSMVGLHRGRGWAMIGLQNEDQTRCSLDIWSCSFASDYFPAITLYGNRARQDVFLTAGMWDMNFRHFDYSGWTADSQQIQVPFHMYTSMNVLAGNPEVPTPLFTIYQGIKGIANLTIAGGPGRYQIETADFELVSNPEPGTLALGATGIIGGAFALWRRRRRAKA